MKFSKITAVFLMAMLTPFVYGGGTHNHEPAVEDPPHGGMLRDAPPFKAEIVIKDDLVKLYIYKKEKKELKQVKYDQKELKGTVQFPRQEKRQQIVFELNGNFYQGKIKGISKAHRFDLHVDLVVGKEKAVADFGIDNLKL